MIKDDSDPDIDVFHSPVKDIDGKYFTIGVFTKPEGPPSLITSDIDGKDHVRVFLTQDSATTFTSSSKSGLQLIGWDSLVPLALQMESCSTKIPFIYLEQAGDGVTKFESVSIDDLLK
ncbi:hypothetical protein Fuma_00797 [Fuerstiella marisgermanici]|uniref:Uncharacterized protein n=1 Tax=Fuerstiella marisgermanici TaxID=1891926 RepID=A0A1P8WAY9_9PLAN|nr:hypothetical protein Fuma_00797 [Fuerstiella marisgermanici]